MSIITRIYNHVHYVGRVCVNKKRSTYAVSHLLVSLMKVPQLRCPLSLTKIISPGRVLEEGLTTNPSFLGR